MSPHTWSQKNQVVSAACDLRVGLRPETAFHSSSRIHTNTQRRESVMSDVFTNDREGHIIIAGLILV